ncbi:MAG: serine/threonine protein kinase [Labilithrix sp.]|nr:serine/threonine protein kinase [Labilithrix sp.]MCW5815002.1 serine/threonine protein kinase [Labilithrix sp.]
MSAGLPATGELLEGKYRIERVIGEGAWGEVLEGVNVRIKRRVAIKVLKAQYASNPAMVGRFEREALASTHIESPHVVQIFDAGVLADGRPYMVMEFLVGEDLGKRIDKAKGNKLSLIESIGYCIQTARGLAAAHAAGIFHRDMKPSNVVIAKTKSGREVAKIVDFGISKLLNDQEATSNTQTGTIMGSPVYMSPEQARGAKTTDHRSDIYSLGVVLYECVTGRTPFVADSFNELLFKIALEEAPTPQNLRPDIDDDLNAIIVKATARAPEARYQTAAELEEALIGWLQKNGGQAGDWATDTGGRGLDLTASPTRGKSLPEILITGETPNAPATTTGANQTDASVSPPATVGKETSTSLSKTADPLKESAGAPPNGSKKKLVYAGAAAALAVIGVIGISTMRGPGTTEVKPDPKTASSGMQTADTATTADSVNTAGTAAPKPSETAPAMDTGDSATTAAADAGATATSATAGTKPAFTHRPAPGPAPAAQPATKPTTPASAQTSVGGRTIRTDF